MNTVRLKESALKASYGKTKSLVKPGNQTHISTAPGLLVDALLTELSHHIRKMLTNDSKSERT